MTARDYLDEIKIRLLRHDLASSFSDPELMSYVNRARRDVQKATIGRFPERFSRISDLAIVENPTQFPARYYCVLPDDLMDVYGVYLNYTSTEATPAIVSSRLRESSQREVSTIMGHTWNKPSMKAPVFVLQKDNILDPDTYINLLYLYIGDVTTDLSTYATNPTVEVWYTLAIGEIEDFNILGQDDEERVIPTMFKEMVILTALKICMERVYNASGLQSVMMDIDNFISIFDMKEIFGFESETILLPSKEGISQ